MIFQSHVVDWYFLSCPIIFLGKRDCEEEAFLSTGLQIQRMSELAVLPSAGVETTWARDLSPWSGLISYFVKLEHFVILKALSVGCCSGVWGLVHWGNISGRICASGGWLLLLRRNMNCCVTRVDVKLCVKSLSAEQYQYIGNDHLNWWPDPVQAINVLRFVVAMCALRGIVLLLASWVDDVSNLLLSSWDLTSRVTLPSGFVMLLAQMFEPVSVHHALHSLLAVLGQAEFKFTLLLFVVLRDSLWVSARHLWIWSTFLK